MHGRDHDRCPARRRAETRSDGATSPDSGDNEDMSPRSVPAPPHTAAGWIRRVAVTVVGVVLIAVGVLLLVLPGPGLLLVLAGLVVMANEYPWARRWTAPVRRQAIAAAKASVATRLRITWTAAVGLALVVAGIVWMTVPGLPFAGLGAGSSLILSGVILLGLLAYSVRLYGGGRADRPSRVE